jgi:hypothetical protein
MKDMAMLPVDSLFKSILLVFVSETIGQTLHGQRLADRSNGCSKTQGPLQRCRETAPLATS